MFNFFKKKAENKTSELVAISHGKLVDLDTVSDPIFAQKMMGDGYALVPNDGKLYSPVSGKVKTIFPTKHAIGITTETGIDVLIHLGFDTVELEGKTLRFKHSRRSNDRCWRKYGERGSICSHTS